MPSAYPIESQVYGAQIENGHCRFVPVAGFAAGVSKGCLGVVGNRLVPFDLSRFPNFRDTLQKVI